MPDRTVPGVSHRRTPEAAAVAAAIRKLRNDRDWSQEDYATLRVSPEGRDGIAA